MDKKRFFTFVFSQVRLRREVKRGKRLGLFGAACVTALFATGCGGFHATIGTSAGIREYHKGMNGLITNGKAESDKDTPYWQTEREAEKERTERDTMYNFHRAIRGDARGLK